MQVPINIGPNPTHSVVTFVAWRTSVRITSCTSSVQDSFLQTKTVSIFVSRLSTTTSITRHESYSYVLHVYPQQKRAWCMENGVARHVNLHDQSNDLPLIHILWFLPIEMRWCCVACNYGSDTNILTSKNHVFCDSTPYRLVTYYRCFKSVLPPFSRQSNLLGLLNIIERL